MHRFNLCFLFTFVAATLSSFLAPDLKAAEPPSNVLFIAIDDMKTIGTLYAEEPGNFLQRVYPDKTLRTEIANRLTPNIQRLADRGVTFMNAYCAAPACNPSRAALMTGVRPHLTGLTTNAGGIFFRDYQYEGKKLLADAVTMPELLQKHGWYTAETGKIFHTARSFKNADGNRSWTAWTDVQGNAGPSKRDRFSPKSLDWGQEGDDHATYKSLNDYRKADFIARVLSEGKATDKETTFAIKPDQPFFLACGIFRPHLPFYATKDLLNLFPTAEMTITRELLDEFTGDAGDLPQQAYKWCGLAVDSNGHPQIGKDRFVDILKHGKKQQPADGDLQGWKQMLQHYFACCAIADRSVGRLLDGLEQSDYNDNTMIILWSDHGYHLGEKLHETKFTLWDDGANVNFIISDPRNRATAGQRCYRPVTLTDIYPTVADMAGVELPDARIKGHNLTPLLADPNRAWAAPAHSTYQAVSNNMLRTDRYKLIRYGNDNKAVELYDMQEDPEEFNNLAGKPEQESNEAKLKTLLDAVIR
jgi:arylsulfatase A-like enzyme